MSAITEDIREKIKLILKNEEEKTDLDNLAVLSRVGMKVASATSSELDADATSASSTALIDLGLRLSEATQHGALKEILLHNASGYSILMAINDEYIVFSGLNNMYRIGYYLGYLRELAKKLKILISGDEITEMALRLEESELEKIRQQQEEELSKESEKVVPSVEQDKEALNDLLGFLDEWDNEEKVAMGLDATSDDSEGNIVGIPDSMSTGIPKESDTVGLPESASSVGIPDELGGLEDFGDLEESSVVGIPDTSLTEEVSAPKPQKTEFKVYDDEVPPVPLEDYTPMDVEEEGGEYAEPQPAPGSPAAAEAPTTKSKYVYETEEEEAAGQNELPSLDELPSFDELTPPDFGNEFEAAEYETEFVLDEESEALDSVLKDLGWDEEDED